MKHLQAHFDLIEKQRAILIAYEPYEHDYDAYMEPTIARAMKLADVAAKAQIPVRVSIPQTFEALYADYHHNLDRAESVLRIACDIGMPLDISDRSVAHDIRCIGEPKRIGALYGSKQRARDNLFATDFHDECGYMPEHGVHVSKVSIPKWLPSKPGADIARIAADFAAPVYVALVIASFEEPADAMLYRLSS